MEESETSKGWLDFDKAKAVRFEVVIKKLGILSSLKQRGDEHKGTCPLSLHTGKKEKPTFSVNFVKQAFNCFGCGKKGGIWTFAKVFNNTEDPKVAARWLLDIAENTEEEETVEVREDQAESEQEDTDLSAHDRAICRALARCIASMFAPITHTEVIEKVLAEFLAEELA